MAKVTKFLKESKTASTDSSGASSAVSNTMLALFKPEVKAWAESILDTMERRNMPRMIKAVDRNGENIPVGGIVAGIIVDVIPSPKSDIKGNLLWLHLVKINGKKVEATGIEITFPASGSIRQALAPGAKGKDDDDDKGKQEAARVEMLKLKGRLGIFTRQPDAHNSKYNKSMGMWDTFVSAEPVDIGVKIH